MSGRGQRTHGGHSRNRRCHAGALAPRPRARAQFTRTAKEEPMAKSRTPETPGRSRVAPIADAAAARAKRPSSTTGVAVTDEARRTMIAENAYLRAERRGFTPGNEDADWLAAEQEVDALLRARHGGAAQ